MDDTDLSDRDPLTKIPGLSPLVASISHFAFILISAQTSRFLANKFIHDRLLRVIAEEFICTAQLCTNNFELGVVTEVYGFSGYAIGLFFTSLSYSSTFEDGTADPSECLDKYCKREMGPKECILRSVASVGGAAISYRASKVFWSFGMIPEHTAAYKGLQQCAASLQVSVVLGVIFEGSLTFVNRLIQGTEGFNMLSSGLSDVAITFCGLFVTGGYFNPSLALAMELGCTGLAPADFFVIYFVGPMIGTLLAFQTTPQILRIVQPEAGRADVAKLHRE